MSEKNFVEQLQRSAKAIDEHAFVWKTNDRFSLGIPDLLIIIKGAVHCIEAKLGAVPVDERHAESMLVLKHPFSGPQISILRQLERAGAFSCGAVKVANDIAYILHPCKIPKYGNFTFPEMEELGARVSKKNGIWRIDEWRTSWTSKRQG